MKTNNFFKYSIIPFFLVIFLISSFSFVNATSEINITAGHIYYALIDGAALSDHWAGLKIINNAVDLDIRIDSFASVPLTFPLIMQVEFPGANLKDDTHYYATMLPDINFNLLNLFNTSESDLTEDNLFSQQEFPTFYPTYYDKSDNPNATFINGTEGLMIGGVNFTALKIITNLNVDYYLLKYNNSGNMTPLFITWIKDSVCYNLTACVSQFMLPINPQPYNFYVLSKYPEYEFDTFIDDVPSATFAQTALSYILRIDASNLYTGLPAPNLQILIGENNGQNIFVPYRLGGYVSKTYSIGLTNSSGSETFLVAPTVYPTTSNYSIYVAAFEEGIVTSKEELFITEKDSLIKQSKPLSPSRLYNNAIVSVNAMNQINNDLFKWASVEVRAHKFRIEYELTTGNFTTYRYTTPIAYVQDDNIKLKTGAPNVFDIYVENSGVPQFDYRTILRETDGYLILDPYTDTLPLNEKEKQNFQKTDVGTEFIVTPTSLAGISSNITLEILNSGGGVVDSYVFDINNTLNFNPTDGISYSNDLLKTIVNAMNQVLSSLYYSLNF